MLELGIKTAGIAWARELDRPRCTTIKMAEEAHSQEETSANFYCFAYSVVEQTILNLLLCEIPLWTKKDKRDNQTGKKISFFRFPKEENLKKQWILAIRRDVGPNFSINKGTWVCSRHFREEDLQMGINGKVSPRTGALPNIFAWKRSSPGKRAPPTPRFTATTLAKKKASEASEPVDSTEIEIIYEDATSTSHMPELAFPETGEVKNITDCECSTDFVERYENDILIAELNIKPSGALANNKESEPGPVVSKLKEKVVDLERKYEKLEERLFSFKNIASNDSLVAFYTGFPNYQTMMALYDFLNPGEHGENINYWLSGKKC